MQPPKPLTGPPPAPILMAHVSTDLAELLANVPHAFVMVEHETVTVREDLAEVTQDEFAALQQTIAPARRTSCLANLIAARRAVTLCTMKHLGLNVSPHDIYLAHRAEGKPELRISNAAHAKAFQEMDISLADGYGLSVAWVGPSPVGVDLEVVEARNCKTWRGLLGDDGYSLALKIERETREPFDSAATRVWTLLEAGKKAFWLRRILPRFASSLANSWLSFKADDAGDGGEFICALLQHRNETGTVAALTVTLGQSTLAASMPAAGKKNCTRVAGASAGNDVHALD